MAEDKRKNIKGGGVDGCKFGLNFGSRLVQLREFTGLSESELAERLRVDLKVVSEIENKYDMKISSLKQYIEGLGATLHIEAVFNKRICTAGQLTEGIDEEFKKEQQLVFSLLFEKKSHQKRDVVLSVKPSYSDKIFEGKKTIELRRRFPLSAPRGTIAYIYSTSPIRAIVGCAEIESVNKLPVVEIWDKYSKKAQISKTDFDNYFEGIADGFALAISNPRTFSRRIELGELRDRFGFEPPQSFLYISSDLRTALRHEFSNVSN